MPKEIVFSEEQQLALLGHIVTNQRVYDAVKHLELDSDVFVRPNPGRIFRVLDRFWHTNKRFPTLTELRTGELKGEDPKIVEGCQRDLQRALELKQDVGLEPIYRDLIALKMSRVLHSSVEEMGAAWNKQETERAVELYIEGARKLEMVSSRGLSAMARSSADWYDVSLERQKATKGRLLYTGLTFLDDPTCGLKPDDLMIFTAFTGFGKSQAMALMAWNMAVAGRKVKFFALEAGQAEMESRLRFVRVSENYHSVKGNWKPIDYTAWSRGLCPELEKYEPSADEMKAVLANIDVTYKLTARYTIDTLERDVLAAAKSSDIIMIDHLHYIDKGSAKKDGNEAMSDIIQRIREVNLTIDRPVVLAAHIRKHSGPRKEVAILPSLDDILGSGDISKCATWVVAVAQPGNADDEKIPMERLRAAKLGQPTFVRILKSRDGGGTRTSYTMVAFFRQGRYADEYTVGRMKKADTMWVPMRGESLPMWCGPKAFTLAD